MKNRLLSAIALIGLMLFSTLGSLAFTPSLSTTKTECTVSVKSVKSGVQFNFDSVFIAPDAVWRSDKISYGGIPTDEGKYDNRPINGILNEESRKKGRKFIE